MATQRRRPGPTDRTPPTGRSLPFAFGEGVPPRPAGWRSPKVNDPPRGSAPFVPFDWDEDGPTAAPARAEDAKPAAPTNPRYTVAALAAALKRGLDEAFPLLVVVEGEVVAAKTAASGHVYFTLKSAPGEPEATLDGVAYKSAVTARGRGLLVDGRKVALFGRPVFWAPRGRLQFVCDRVEDAGAGAHREELVARRERLAAEGLLDSERKRPLPRDPRIIGVVTSRSGAVVHDIRTVAFRRGGAHLLVAPTTVQGAGAAEGMIAALRALCAVRGVDVILLARGGGSAEDLAPFQDEALCRAVAASPVPVVAAVGHDGDTPLVDLVADARAATPSQAAEMVVPDRASQAAVLAERFARLQRAAAGRLSRARLQVVRLERKVQDPRVRLARARAQLAALEGRLVEGIRRQARGRHATLRASEQRLRPLDPRVRLAKAHQELAAAAARLDRAVADRAHADRARLAPLAARLDALSPLRVLARGYAIAQRGDGAVVRAPADAPPGTRLTVRLAEGQLTATVDREGGQ